MSSGVRDKKLLDALDALEQRPFGATVWRSVRSGRASDECSLSGGRWDDGSFEVLYTSTTREAAIEERRFHLFRGQPFPPSKISYELFTIEIELSTAVEFQSTEQLEKIGMDVSKYGMASYANKAAEYPRSQEIAEACYFLGTDGIIVPSARHDSSNVIVFCDQNPSPRIGEPAAVEKISWT